VPFAVDDAYAPVAGLDGVSQEFRDCALRRQCPQAVQVEVCLDAELAAAQPTQYPTLQPGSVKLEFFAGFEVGVIEFTVQHFLAHGRLFTNSLRRYRWRASPFNDNPIMAQRFNAGELPAEEIGV